MKSSILILTVLLLLSATTMAQPIGWTCLRNDQGDTLKPYYTVSAMLQGRDGNLYFPASLNNATSSHIFRWNDTTWNMVDSTTPTALGGSVGGPLCQDARGRLYATTHDGTGRWYVAMWNDTTWSVIEGAGTDTLGAYYTIYDLCTDTAGYLYAATMSSMPGSKPFVSRWDGTGWTRISAGLVLNQTVKTLCADKLGNIYAAGILPVSVNNLFVAKWDGTTWTELGTGANGLQANAAVATLWCDAQNNVYAGGSFVNTNGRHYVAKWNGTAWSELGTGAGALQANGDILAIYTDAQNNVYAAGTFKNDSARLYVARYDGTAWTELGAGPFPLAVSTATSVSINCIAGDSKGNIYAGGSFFGQGGNGLNVIARYGIAPKLSVQALTVGSNISIYPNPASQQLYVKAQQITGMSVCNMAGRVMSSNTFPATGQTTISLTDLPPGTYLLKLVDSQGGVHMHKIVKE